MSMREDAARPRSTAGQDAPGTSPAATGAPGAPADTMSPEAPVPPVAPITPVAPAVPVAPVARAATIAGVILLIVLGVAWETWLAPLRPGAWTLALKVLPLALLLPGLRASRRRSVQWLSLLLLAYLTEGIMRGMGDEGLSSTLGWIETALATATFLATLAWARAVWPRPPRPPKAVRP